MASDPHCRPGCRQPRRAYLMRWSTQPENRMPLRIESWKGWLFERLLTGFVRVYGGVQEFSMRRDRHGEGELGAILELSAFVVLSVVGLAWCVAARL